MTISKEFIKLLEESVLAAPMYYAPSKPRDNMTYPVEYKDRKANDTQIAGPYTVTPDGIKHYYSVKEPEISLSKGYRAMVDIGEFDLLNSVKWSALTTNKLVYAVRIDTGKYVYMHRLIMNASSDELVDHVDGNTLNNKRSNLRLATKSQNGINRPSTSGVSKYKGVWFDSRQISKPWNSEVTKDGKKYRLGSFRTEQEAALAYNIKAVELFGEFAWENIIE